MAKFNTFTKTSVTSIYGRKYKQEVKCHHPVNSWIKTNTFITMPKMRFVNSHGKSCCNM